jgi:hypothetical protein
MSSKRKCLLKELNCLGSCNKDCSNCTWRQNEEDIERAREYRNSMRKVWHKKRR